MLSLPSLKGRLKDKHSSNRREDKACTHDHARVGGRCLSGAAASRASTSRTARGAGAGVPRSRDHSGLAGSARSYAMRFWQANEKQSAQYRRRSPFLSSHHCSEARNRTAASMSLFWSQFGTRTENTRNMCPRC
jgi:hypothetical protein